MGRRWGCKEQSYGCAFGPLEEMWESVKALAHRLEGLLLSGWPLQASPGGKLRSSPCPVQGASLVKSEGGIICRWRLALKALSQVLIFPLEHAHFHLLPLHASAQLLNRLLRLVQLSLHIVHKQLLLEAADARCMPVPNAFLVRSGEVLRSGDALVQILHLLGQLALDHRLPGNVPS